ncbi:MAG: hypothetical protein ABIS47_00850 [Acidimicrobiales bacterium]
MDPKLVFLFYLAAVACFALAAAGDLGGRGRALTRVSLVPLGLALYVFPQMWNAGVVAF